MNAIRQVQELNKKELENVVPPEASWHADYRDTAYIYIGSLPYDLSEGDILTIFSQYGEPVHLNLVRDKETGKSKGFAFLKYEDQRSTDLAVDNLGGATVLGRMIRVDHVRYKRKEEEGLEDNVATLTVGETGLGESRRDDNGKEGRRRRTTKHSESDTDAEDRRIQQKPLLKEEKELQKLIEEHDDEDPMKEYLIQEKREEVARALEHSSNRKKRRGDSTEREDKHDHRRRHHRSHHRRHRDDRSYSREEGRKSSRRERSRSPSQSRERRHHRDRVRG
ncbi:RNA binding domain-containing protein [Blastomyces gilchristii SLH14081]|uniref:RNA binding domain-containing protein n=1 Tax=Blastomyces gilchristii (strain SLH14081) TaxID=559298 RepID=A0A179U9D6_BLAGS|nr:RNA binding domain-containing protein [Blastomyces gilchristii SLH14081]OAT04616.1 RNA binding domain-containing protein [Blastomyces gilchristii SLH14081]